MFLVVVVEVTRWIDPLNLPEEWIRAAGEEDGTAIAG